MWEIVEEPGANWATGEQDSHLFDGAVFDIDIFDAEYGWIDSPVAGDGWV